MNLDWIRNERRGKRKDKSGVNNFKLKHVSTCCSLAYTTYYYSTPLPYTFLTFSSFK